MKWDNQVDELIESLNHATVDIRDKIFNAHSTSRRSILTSGVSINKVLTMWVRIQKSQY